MNRTVVATREANLYHDSYFYATFHNPTETGLGEFTEEMIGSTAFAGGCYDMEINASPEVHVKYEKWLPIKAAYDARYRIARNSLVYSPKARKYRSMGVVEEVAIDRYDSREWVALVTFAEGKTWMRTNKLQKFQPFVQTF